ncbi:MAG: sarcosine oxidase subunit gamma, partial [Mangrovicoccus sp.]|nr:sarcosine oxidase subunit gamma [Mangrovicoccus sp.]
MTTTGGATEVKVRDLTIGSRISLRLGDPASAASSLGLALPACIDRRAVTGGRSALCLGPDEWLIEAAGDAAAALSAALAGLAAQTPLSAVDISDREIARCLDGPAVPDLLATGCPLDLARM